MSVEVEIHSREMKVNDHLFNYVNKKVSNLDRYLHGITNAKVDLSYIKTARNASDRQVAQITVRGKGFILRAEERTDDIFSAFDNALDKIQRRIERYKGKRHRGRGDGTSVAQTAIEAMSVENHEIDEVITPIVVRRKKFILLPMDEIEAIEQMNLLGHEDFFVFFNINTNSVNVLYRRRDGNYGLIETEVG
jgi:putative sigma-54 modulation protein